MASVPASSEAALRCETTRCVLMKYTRILHVGYTNIAYLLPRVGKFATRMWYVCLRSTFLLYDFRKVSAHTEIAQTVAAMPQATTRSHHDK